MKRKKSDRKWHRMEVMFELLLFGIIFGIIEDVLAIKLTTGESITWRMIGIVILIAVPFAIIGEVIFDNVNFAKIFKKIFGGKIKKKTARAIKAR